MKDTDTLAQYLPEPACTMHIAHTFFVDIARYCNNGWNRGSGRNEINLKNATEPSDSSCLAFLDDDVRRSGASLKLNFVRLYSILLKLISYQGRYLLLDSKQATKIGTYYTNGGISICLIIKNISSHC